MSQEQVETAGWFHSRFPALSERNFRLFIVGQIISLTGTWMQGPALKWVVFKATGSTQALGMVDFLGQIPITVLVIATGAFADRHSRLRIVTATQACLMVVAFGYGLFSHAGFLSMGAIYTLVILGGIAQAFDVPARQSFVMEMAGRRSLSNALAINSATFNGARIIGPTVGAVVLAAVGAMWCFILNGVSYLAVIWALLSMRDLHERAAGKTGRGLRNLVDGVQYVRGHRLIVPLLALTGAYGLFGNYFSTLLPKFARDIYGQAELGYGLLFSAIGVGACAGAIVTALASSPKHLVTRTATGLLLVSLTSLGLAVTKSYPLALALSAVLGFGMMSFLGCSNILIQHLAEEQYVGRVIGLRHFAFGGMFPFGALIAGYGAERIGPVRTVAASAVVLFILTLALMRRVFAITAVMEARDAAAAS